MSHIFIKYVYKVCGASKIGEMYIGDASIISLDVVWHLLCGASKLSEIYVCGASKLFL